MEIDFDRLKDDRKRVTGKRIKLLREEMRMTLDEFGRKIGLEGAGRTLTTKLCNIENGKSELDIDTTIIISKIYDVSINWLLGISPINIKKEKFYNIQKYTGLSESAIDRLHSLCKGDLKEKEEKQNYINIRKENEYIDYESYLYYINKIIPNNILISVISNLRKLDIVSKNEKDNDDGISINMTSKRVILSNKKAREFLLQQAKDECNKLMEDIIKSEEKRKDGNKKNR